MKVGLFGARTDDRGLGRLTHDFYSHMEPDRTLVVDMGSHAHGFTQHLDRYPDATVVPFNSGHLPDDTMTTFFTGLDVAVFYETAYDHRAYDIARAAGCRTVLMTMPEFHRHATEALPHPDVVWAPTTWRLDTLPADTRVVPVPVTIEATETHRRRDGLLRVLHVAGHRTSGDRNGTIAFLRALRHLRRNAAIRVVTQDRRLPNVQNLPRHMPVTLELGGVADHRHLYAHSDILVMPRRFGGLCLPVQEAMGSGLGVVMTDCDPNPATWPIVPLRTRPGITIRTPGGPVVLHDPDPVDIANMIDRLIIDPAEVADLKTRAREWAAAHSWDVLLPLYQAELERAATTAVAA